MEAFRRLEDVSSRFRQCVLSIGKFDGLHLGHKALFERAVALSHEYGVPTLAFTFDRAPSEVLGAREIRLPLCTLEEKVEILGKWGVDGVLFYPTTSEFFNLSAREFFQSIVVDKLGAVAMVEGENFNFGRNKEGSNELLARLCSENGVRLEISRPVEYEGEPVSCSRIRKALERGDVRGSALQLGRYYGVNGIVADGRKVGRTLGFPTANLEGVKTLMPAHGVYAGKATLADGRVFPAAINYGSKPTYQIDEVTIEPHLIGFSGDLYDRPLRLEFLERIRDIGDFSHDPAGLQAQIKLDLPKIQKIYDDRIF